MPHKFQADYTETARLTWSMGGFSLVHRGGRYGSAATEAIMSAVPRLAEQKNQSLDGYELWISYEELLADPATILIKLDEAGINTRQARAWLKNKKGIIL